MNRFRHFWWPAILMLCLAGCYRPSVHDGQGKASPDGQLRLAVKSRGVYQRPYHERTRKVIEISVRRAGGAAQRPLFQQRYRIVGSDVSWHTQWLSPSNVVVQLFDYGDGVRRLAAPTHPPERPIRTIRFRVDRQSGNVTEDTSAG